MILVGCGLQELFLLKKKKQRISNSNLFSEFPFGMQTQLYSKLDHFRQHVQCHVLIVFSEEYSEMSIFSKITVLKIEPIQQKPRFFAIFKIRRGHKS